jgi:sulfur transfer complex TusBCD TusB component (DsrH family)
MKGILAAMPGPPSEHSLDKVADRSFQMADKLIARGNYVEPIKDKVAPTDNAKSVGVGG